MWSITIQLMPIENIQFNWLVITTIAQMSKYQKEQLKNRLTPIQYKVTQESATEQPYTNQYYLSKKKGVYRCVVCTKQLFTSQMKYQKACGWPAFYDQIESANIKKITNPKHGKGKTEVRCSECDSHLGHLFKDVAGDKGIRYCVNSASLKLQQEI